MSYDGGCGDAGCELCREDARIAMANWSTSDVARVYKDRGVANPVEAACGGVPSAKPHKYNARKKAVDGITFDSTAEANAYIQLRAMRAAGAIFGLQLQPRYVLQDAFRDEAGKWHRKVEYVGDFKFLRDGKEICVDVKGMETPVFKLKQKLFAARFPNVTLEVWK